MTDWLINVINYECIILDVFVCVRLLNFQKMYVLCVYLALLE